ncbi:GNAT family N-acetyltransferase [Thiohalophilus sp.]|uniref:GNAT family N-acetyltransferase n=1 Tax=Thiohalophilus sp. TaxID=3028392 RepID=UPI0039750761
MPATNNTFSHTYQKNGTLFRPLQESDVNEYAEMLYSSFNDWYWKHGWGKNYFSCQSQQTRIFFDIYNDLTPGKSIAAFCSETGKIMGACFYHPRKQHVSLGIMSVHPDYTGRGIGRAMVDHILNYTREHEYRSCRLVGSAINMDSFSLYNRAGFIPRETYHDMVLNIPNDGFIYPVENTARIREATLQDIPAMVDLEMEISGIHREMDFEYAISNPRGCLHASVYVNDYKQIDGFILSTRHPALHMMGPCVARTELIANSLLGSEANRFKGTWVLFSIPMRHRKMVEQMYQWGAVNVETHLKQVWGEFHGFNGVSMPSFLPETG